MRSAHGSKGGEVILDKVQTFADWLKRAKADSPGVERLELPTELIHLVSPEAPCGCRQFDSDYYQKGWLKYTLYLFVANGKYQHNHCWKFVE